MGDEVSFFLSKCCGVHMSQSSDVRTTKIEKVHPSHGDHTSGGVDGQGPSPRSQGALSTPAELLLHEILSVGSIIVAS